MTQKAAPVTLLNADNDGLDDEDDSATEQEEEEEEDGEDPPLLSLLKDKTFVKQHSIAVVVAIVGASMGYFHSSLGGTSGRLIAEERASNPTAAYHHSAYRRTSNLNFCLDDDAERLEASDPHVHLWQFNFPKEYVRVMELYYRADDLMSDGYNMDAPSDMSQHAQYRCLQQAASQQQSRSTLSVTSIAYKQPSVSNFYQQPSFSDSTLVVASAQPHTNIKEASLTHQGFAAKFINLSSKPLNLYWDGGSATRHLLIATVPPMEAAGTATTPGNSFHFTPTYHTDHVLARWVLTADDAIAVYDPYKPTSDMAAKEALAKYTRELTTVELQQSYQMQKLNLAYAKEYLVQTGRTWYSMFPRPTSLHFMHPAHYFGQKIVVTSQESHFVKRMPPHLELTRLSHRDHELVRGEIQFKEYRTKGDLELTLSVKSVAPRCFEIDHFLSSVEVQHILDLASRYNVTSLEDSTVSGSTDQKQKSKARTSTTAWIHREFSPIIDAIYRRAADVLHIDERLFRHRHEHSELNTHHSIAEAMQLVRYRKGEEYTPHHDFLYPSVGNRYQPSRFATVLLYLNDVKEGGGETVFPRAVNSEYHDGIKIVPKAGKAVLFYNVLPDGNMDDLSQHGGNKAEGEKWVANLWIWDPIID